MIAGPGAAYICNECLQLCTEILNEQTPFSEKALELASRPPVVIATPQVREQHPEPTLLKREPTRTITIELEQKQHGMTLMLHQLHYYTDHFELRFLWIRPPLTSGFTFVPRLIFFLTDSTGMQWPGDRGGHLLARPELANGPNHAVYQGNARFQPLPSPDARMLTVRATDPLGQFEEPAPHAWHFDITLFS